MKIPTTRTKYRMEMLKRGLGHNENGPFLHLITVGGSREGAFQAREEGVSIPTSQALPYIHRNINKIKLCRIT